MRQRRLSAVKKPIRSVSETAFQRAILINGDSELLGIGNVKWLDIELPVNKGRRVGRGECVDLIGKGPDGYVLCELKFKKGDSTSNSPQEAYNEHERYCKQISENWMELDALNLHHIDCDEFSWKDIAEDIRKGTIRKVIAANKDYWEYWLLNRRNDPCSDIMPYMNQGYHLYSLAVDGFQFFRQKGSREMYIPELGNVKWERL